MTSHFSAPGKYVPLVRYLEALPADQQRVTLTFAQLEALVGPLSLSARAVNSYWVRRGPLGAQCAQHGFGTKLHRLDRAVTFTRLTASARADED